MLNDLPEDLQNDIHSVQQIPGLPAILELICYVTGMGFSTVARVTSDHWIACRVRDEINFGLVEGGELKVETTICSWIRDHKAPVVFNDITNETDQLYHDVAAMYGFASYISYPIVSHGRFFGTLCAIDPRVLDVQRETVRAMFLLFAEWISFGLQKKNITAEFKDKASTILSNFSWSTDHKHTSRTEELLSELKTLLT